MWLQFISSELLFQQFSTPFNRRDNICIHIGLIAKYYGDESVFYDPLIALW